MSLPAFRSVTSRVKPIGCLSRLARMGETVDPTRFAAKWKGLREVLQLMLLKIA